MNAAQHTPGPGPGLEISLRIGQRVRHQDFHGKRVTGIVRGLSVDSEDVLHADIALDEAIVIPPINEDDHELRIYRQHVPAHELAPFDEREELIAGMREAAEAVAAFIGGAKDRLGRPDPAANEEMRAARERIRELAVRYGVAAGHHTYIDQCAAVLRAAIAKATGSAS